MHLVVVVDLLIGLINIDIKSSKDRTKKYFLQQSDANIFASRDY